MNFEIKGISASIFPVPADINLNRDFIKELVLSSSRLEIWFFTIKECCSFLKVLLLRSIGMAEETAERTVGDL